jgi:hypothetical protein
METRDLKNDTAFPTPDYIMENSCKIDFNPIGMSKRFYAACAAMQGLLANPNTAGQLSRQLPKSAPIEAAYSSVVVTAYSIADEMLKQENE